MSEPDDSVTDIQGRDVDNRATEIFDNFSLELRAKHNVNHSAIDFIAKNIGGKFNGIAPVCDFKQYWKVVLPIVERVTLRLKSNMKETVFVRKIWDWLNQYKSAWVLVLNLL